MHKFLKVTSYLLVLIGALNWGLIGLFDFNLVSYLFGEMTVVSRVIYSLVGISAIIFAIAEHVYEKKYCIQDCGCFCRAAACSEYHQGSR